MQLLQFIVKAALKTEPSVSEKILNIAAEIICYLNIVDDRANGMKK